MAVILPSVYKDGTATVNNGSTTVNGQNTLFINSVLPGDFFGSSQGVWVRIESVNANDSLTLSHPWPEATQTAAPYEIMLQSDNARMQETSRQLLETLSSGNNYSLGQLNGNVDQIPIFSAPGVFTLVSKNELLSGVNFDVIVNDMAGRAAFDNQNTGFTVLVIDIGDGRSAAYAKNSATPGDWSDPIYVTGEQGESGPYTEITVGTVSTVPYGTPANVTATPVDEDTIALNFEIPAGMNGSGIGDMLASVYDPTGQARDAFQTIRTDAAQLLTAAQKGQVVENFGGGFLAGFRNKIINPLGAVNQRGVSGTVTLSAGQYGHDRFKAGASGCTYTFSTVNGVTTFSITAGTLLQVIEASAFAGMAGNYILGWEGNAQARINDGSYDTSGNVSAVLNGGANASVEWSTGTLALPHLDFDYLTAISLRDIEHETSLCQRFCELVEDQIPGMAFSAGNLTFSGKFQTRKRLAPFVTALGLGSWVGNGSLNALGNSIFGLTATDGYVLDSTLFSGTVTQGFAYVLRGHKHLADAEL